MSLLVLLEVIKEIYKNSLRFQNLNFKNINAINITKLTAIIEYIIEPRKAIIKIDITTKSTILYKNKDESDKRKHWKNNNKIIILLLKVE